MPANLLVRHKRISFMLVAAAMVATIAILALPVASVPDTTRMPFQVEYEWRGGGEELGARHVVTMESWTRWHYQQSGGTADGYTVIADGTGRVVAGYPEWSSDEWVELQPEGTKGIVLPRSWLRPYFFAPEDPMEGRPIRDADLESEQARLGIAAADNLDGFTDESGVRVVFHVQTGVPLDISDSSGFALEAVRVEEVQQSKVTELIAPSRAVPEPGDAKGATTP
jgi:hypothetical protein